VKGAFIMNAAQNVHDSSKKRPRRSSRPPKQRVVWTQEDDDHVDLQTSLSKRTRAELVQWAEQTFNMKVNKKMAHRALVKELCNRIEQSNANKEDTIDKAVNGGAALATGEQSKSLACEKMLGTLVSIGILVLMMAAAGVTRTQSSNPALGLTICCTTNSSSSCLVQRLVLAARLAASGQFSTGPPHSLVVYNTTLQDATIQLESFAHQRFSSSECEKARVVLNGHQFDERTVLKQLRAFPDSLILIDWTNGSMRNLDVLKRVLDSRCALEGCHDITRDASLFYIATNLSKIDFLKQLGGVDIVARTTEHSLL
jgi:hypothetical protein